MWSCQRRVAGQHLQWRSPATRRMRRSSCDEAAGLAAIFAGSIALEKPRQGWAGLGGKGSRKHQGACGPAWSSGRIRQPSWSSECRAQQVHDSLHCWLSSWGWCWRGQPAAVRVLAWRRCRAGSAVQAAAPAAAGRPLLVTLHQGGAAEGVMPHRHKENPRCPLATTFVKAGPRRSNISQYLALPASRHPASRPSNELLLPRGTRAASDEPKGPAKI